MTVVSELRRLLAEATEGEWYAVKGPDWNEDDGGYLGWMVMQSPKQEICDTGRFRERAQEDAALIVALRNHADALLDVVAAADRLTATYRTHLADDSYQQLVATLDRLDGKETP